MTSSAVLVTIDSLRKDFFADGDAPRDLTTPTFDDLTGDEETVTHQNYWAAGCETGSNSKVLLSGQPGYEFGSPYSGGLDPRRSYLPELLPDEVTTIAVTTNVWLTREYGWDRGWDHFVDFHGGDESEDQDDEGDSHGLWELRRHLSSLISAAPLGETAIHTAYRQYGQMTGTLPFPRYPSVVERLESVLDKVTPPLCVWVHLMEPHTPWLPVDSGSSHGSLSIAFSHGRLETDQRRLTDRQCEMLRDLYARRVEAADAAVGGVLDAVRKRDLFEDALTMVTADHGESLGEHGWFGHGHLDMPKQLYPELVHLPMVVRAPGRPVDRSVAGHVDVVPTICDWFGANHPPATGRTLLAGQTESAGQNRLRWCGYDHPPDDREGVAGTDGRWLYFGTESPEVSQEELYDLETDPGAVGESIDDRPDLIDRFRTPARERLASRDDREKETTASDDVRERLADLGYR